MGESFKRHVFVSIQPILAHSYSVRLCKRWLACVVVNDCTTFIRTSTALSSLASLFATQSYQRKTVFGNSSTSKRGTPSWARLAVTVGCLSISRKNAEGFRGLERRGAACWGQDSPPRDHTSKTELICIVPLELYSHTTNDAGKFQTFVARKSSN